MFKLQAAEDQSTCDIFLCFHPLNRVSVHSAGYAADKTLCAMCQEAPDLRIYSPAGAGVSVIGSQ
jgi:hypothetical protein